MIHNNLPSFKQALASHGRLLGLDVGEKTIGLAMSDGLRMIATPLKVIARTRFTAEAAALKEIFTQFEISGLVIGWPVNMNGTEGPRCQSTRQFAKNLSAQLPIPMLLWDERMSTMAANNSMLEADLSRAKRAERVDKVAASLILQSALDGLGR